MGAVSVDVSRRKYFTGIDRTGRLRAVHEKTRTDQLVVTVGVDKLRPGLAYAVPVLRWLVEDQFVFHPVVTPAQPAAEERHFRPGALAKFRTIGLARVLHGRVLRRNAAVDNADDDAVAAQSERAAQAIARIEQLEEVGTEVGRQRANLVFPDTQDLLHVFGLDGLRGRHARSKTVQRIAIAVNRLDVRADTQDDFCLLRCDLLNMRFDERAVLVELRN